MGDLPHQAIITPVPLASMHKVLARCIICQATPETIYEVLVPMKWIDDKIRIPVEASCCSEQHALEWLRNYEPELQEKDRRLPSETMERGWIDVYRKHGTYLDDHPQRSGKWLIWLSTENIDRYWKRIRAAVELGYLGNWAKVSTAGSIREDRPDHVVCVYTYDYEDKEDVMKVRDVLRKIGIKQRIRYKADEDTAKLLYGSKYTPKYQA